MTRSFAFAAVAFALLSFAWWGHTAAPPQPAREKAPAVTKWEYKVIAPSTWTPAEIEKQLNDLGADGWEVVNFTSSNGNPSGQVPYFRAVLKRPKR